MGTDGERWEQLARIAERHDGVVAAGHVVTGRPPGTAARHVRRWLTDGRLVASARRVRRVASADDGWRRRSISRCGPAPRRQRSSNGSSRSCAAPAGGDVARIEAALVHAGGHTMLERLFLELMAEIGAPRPTTQRVHRDDDRTVAVSTSSSRTSAS